MKIPILMYHIINNSGHNDHIYTISLNEFKKHMEYLYNNNYSTISLDNFVARYKNKEKFNNKLVILTFDDGHISNYVYAYPLLRDYGFTATFFVSVANVGKEGYMNWQEISEIYHNGMTIGSHSFNHRILTGLSETEVRHELSTSKNLLEDRLRTPINLFSIPRGFCNNTIKHVAYEVGYTAVCTSDVGYNNSKTDLFSLKRFVIKRTYKLDNFKSIVKGDLSFLFTRKVEEKAREVLQKSLGINNYDRLKSKFWKVPSE